MYSNYEQLKKAVIKQTKRSDLDLKFDDFLAITDVEIRSNPSCSLKLNLSELVTELTASTVTRVLALPTNLQSSRKFSITLDDGIHSVEYRTPQQMTIRPYTGIPCFFTVRANQIEFDILPDQAYTVTLTYTANVEPLTEAAPTNYILTKYPNIYLYGCLKQSAIYTEEWQNGSLYDGMFSEAIKAANLSEHNIKYPSFIQETVHWAP